MPANAVTAKKAKKPKMPASRKIFIICMLAYPVLHFLIFWGYVNIDTVILSIQKFSILEGKETFVWFENYARFFEDWSLSTSQTLKYAIVNSIGFLIFNNFILLPISIVCAYLLFKKVLGYQVFRVIFFLPSIISAVVLTMAFSFMFNTQFGIVVKLLRDLKLDFLIPANGFLGTKGVAQRMIYLYCLWAGIGYNVLLLSGAISRVPEEILEAGKIDGIGMTRELFQVIVPLIFPTISTLFIMGSMVMFTLFLQPMLLTQGGPNGSTYTIAYYIVDLVNNNKIYEAASVGILFSVVGIPIVQFIKWFMEKITPQVEF